jgi:ACS family hexuronate transporter-like MFS transporter
MTTAHTTRSSHWKWWITGILLLATTINYMDRVTLANASVRVTKEFDLSDAQYGNLEWVFGWAFAAGSLVFGFLADRIRIYWLYPCVLAGWSMMGMISGWTQNYTELLVCRTLLGFFEAGHWPCALKTTFAILNEKDRTMGNSILQSGASVGAIITPQVMKLLMTDDISSWRSAFIVVGAAGFLWVAIWFIMLRPKDLDAPKAEVSSSPRFFEVVFTRNFWALAILITGTQTVWHMYRVWLVKFLQTGRGYPEIEALNFNSLYFISTDVGCILAGVASLWLVKHFHFTPHQSRRWVYTVACGLTSLSIFLPTLGQGWVLLGVLLLIGAGALALFPCYYTFVQEISATQVGFVTGLLSFWVWFITSPLHTAFGKLADATGSYDLGLVLAGLSPWLGVISMAILWRSSKQEAH